jgi:P4 family phage/plasmid primase-like protien
MTLEAVRLTAEQRAALDVAREMAAAGIPLFVAQPSPDTKLGFTLPDRWQRTEPDPGVVDRWRPGLALCAVMGCGLDAVDGDPRNGGDLSQLNGTTPRVYAIAATPSGGNHLLVASLGTGSRDNVYPGIDVKSGLPDGSGRGFIFIAPTVRRSVVTGEPVAYRWLQRPDLAALNAALQSGSDTTGAPLAARIRELRGASGGMREVGGPDWWRSFIDSREPQSVPAAERAITAKLAEVTSWTTQNGTGFRLVLQRAALTLGGYVGGGYLDEGEARNRLEGAVSEVWGAPNADDLLWIQQGLDDGAIQPFHVYTAEDELLNAPPTPDAAGEGTRPPEPPWNVYSVLTGEPFDPSVDGSDQGLAKAVAHRMYPTLRYAIDSGLWVKREREVWNECAGDMSDWIVSIMAELMPLGSTPVPKEIGERTEQHWQAVRRAQFMSTAGTSKIASKLRAILRSDHPAALKVASLDANPEVFWAGAVPWDLRASGDIPTPASWIDPSTPHLRTALCAPDPTVPTPRWDAFLAAVMPDPEIRAWALRVLSIALTGYPDAALPVPFGPERTGKTSMIQMMVTVLGSYAHAASPKLLNAQDNSHDTIVYDLRGRRLSFIDEGPKRGHEATERLKQLTGGGSLTARPMRANPVTFMPTHTLVLTTNNEPHLTDPALRARVRLIPCNSPEEIVRPARLPLLDSGLTEEAPGILAALMRETAAYLADRDSASTAAAPIVIRGLAKEMADGQDPVREWVETCTVPADPGTPGRALFTAFARWHQDNPVYRRMSVPSETAFGRTLTEMGHPSAKVGGLAYRPLSVLSGSAGVAPWEPMPDPTMTRGAEGTYGSNPADASSASASGGLMEGSGGLESENPPTEFSQVNPGISSSSGGLEGFYPLQKEEINTHTPLENMAAIVSKTLQPQNLPAKTAPDQAKQVQRVESAQTLQKINNEEKSETLFDLEKPSPSVVEPSEATHSETPGSRDPSAADLKAQIAELRRLGVPVTAKQGRDLDEVVKREARGATRQLNADVARRAVEAKISKAEARAQLKAEARIAAIQEASGETLLLPVVVDRHGNLLPLTVGQAVDVVRAAIDRSGALTVDVETSGYPVGHAHYALRSVQLGDDTAAVVFHPVDHADEIRALLAAAPALHAHSATADLVPLAHAGLVEPEDAWERMHDTVIRAKLADPASTGSDPGLKQLSGAVLGESSVAPAAEAARSALFKAGKWLEKTKVDTPIERSGWAQAETGSTTMLCYAASDVLDTAALAKAIPRPAQHVYERERTAQRMTARVAYHGVRLDAEHIAVLTEKHTTGRAESAVRVRAFGVDNPGSDQQVGQAVSQLGAELPKTTTGRPSVAAGVLEPLKGAEGALGDLIRGVLDYRHHDTALGLFLEPYRLLCERGDGRARPTVYTLGTDTGRMCCVRPNLQQLPREGGMRACITADPGQLMIGADFSGVEIRVAAALSQDPTLLRLLAEGRDLHAEVALQVWGANPEASAKAGVPTASKANRYQAKRIVFGRLYGGGLATLAMQAGVSEPVAQSALDVLDALTPTLTAWSRSIRQAVQRGQTQFRSYSGRVIHLPREFPHKGPNYCIQGSARELLVDALVKWRDTPWGICTLLPVHDELDGFVPAGDAEAATQMLVQCMETELFGVKIVAEPSVPSFAWQDSV